MGDNGDKLLVDFLSFLADYVPTLPDELVDYYASSSGFQCSDVGVKRLMSVAAQKFIAAIASDAFQFCRMRQAMSGGGAAAAGGKQQQQRRMMLTHDDLVSALKEYGVEMKRPEYFADSQNAGVTAAAGAAPAPPSNAPPATTDQ